MNKMISRLGLLCAVILIFFSCDDPFKLGLNLQPEDQLLKTTYTDTTTITSKVILLDTVHMKGAGSFMAGSIKDAKFGTTRATGYARVLVREKYTLPKLTGKTPVFDSAVVSLRIRGVYGDSTVPQTISLHNLAYPLDTARNYTAASSVPATELIGSRVYAGRVTNNVLRIPLTGIFSRELFDGMYDSEFPTQAGFENFLKGIRISASGPEDAAVLSFDATGSTSSVFSVHYHFRLDNGKDSLMVANVAYFVESGASSRVPKIFTHIESNLDKSLHLSRLSPGQPLLTSQAGNEGYVQGGTGIATLIDFPHLRSLNVTKDPKLLALGLNPTKDSIMVNRATLSLNPAPGTYSNVNQPPPGGLTFAYADASGKRVYNTGGTISYLNYEGLFSTGTQDATAIMNYNSSARSYLDLDITSYIQDLMNNPNRQTPNYLLINFPNTNAVNKLVFGDNKATHGYRMHLKLYYTIAKK